MTTAEPIAFVDLGAMQRPLHDDLRAAFNRVLDHGRYVLGPEVATFESALASYVGVDHTVGVSSGTDALLATFLALDYPPGSEVITTPFTFISTATSVLRAGLRPVFADLPVDGLHPDAAAIEAMITPKTRAVLVVHLFGSPVDLAAISALCDAHGLDLIEDCAQAIGARTDGCHVGSIGRAGTLSFFPAKNLGALGDGGAVLTNDEELAARVRAVRQHGCVVKYRHDRLGGNFRLDALQAAMLGVLLPALDGWLEQRRANAKLYDVALSGLADAIALPKHVQGHTYNQYVIRSEQRDAIKARLTQERIGCAIYYPFALHTQPALAAAGPLAECPNAVRRCDEVLALPIAPGLRPNQVERIAAVLADVVASGG